MPSIIRAPKRLIDLDDITGLLNELNDGYVMVYDHDTVAFGLQSLVVASAHVHDDISRGMWVYDDFERADTTAPDLGAALTGHTWDMREAWIGGPSLPAATSSGSIQSGRYSLDNGLTSYATLALGVTPNRIGGVVSWNTGNGGAAPCSAVMAISLNDALITDMLHVSIDPSAWYLQVRASEGAFVTLATGALTLATDGTEYPVELFVHGTTAYLSVGGAAVAAVTDKRFATLSGPYVFWEVYTAVGTYSKKAYWHSVWCGADPHPTQATAQLWRPGVSNTNTPATLLTLAPYSTGTAAEGFGVSIAAQLESSTTADMDAGNLTWAWSDAAHASRTSYLALSTVNSGTLGERMRIAGMGVVINEGGDDADTRIEGNNNANLFFADAGNDRIGIKTDTPVLDLDIRVANGGGFQLAGPTAGNTLQITVVDGGGAYGFGIFPGASCNLPVIFYNTESGSGLSLAVRNNGGSYHMTYLANLDAYGMISGTNDLVLQAAAYGAYPVHIGGYAVRSGTAGTAILNIYNGTAPVGTLTDGISIYSSGGECYIMDAAGNATLQSPHDPATGEWIFYSRNTVTGRVYRVDMERMVAAIERITGESFTTETFEVI